jgi:septal ring factor EnvC (AmiA/AmiB activator)
MSYQNILSQEYSATIYNPVIKYFTEYSKIITILLENKDNSSLLKSLLDILSKNGVLNDSQKDRLWELLLHGNFNVNNILQIIQTPVSLEAIDELVEYYIHNGNYEYAKMAYNMKKYQNIVDAFMNGIEEQKEEEQKKEEQKKEEQKKEEQKKEEQKEQTSEV